jgi:heme/copper-type cytochrome/quinol oxidase subunit 2
MMMMMMMIIMIMMMMMMMMIIIIVSRKQQSDAETGSIIIIIIIIIIINNMSKHYTTLYQHFQYWHKSNKYVKRHDRVRSTPRHYMQGNKVTIRKGTLICACTKTSRSKQ